MRLPDDEVRPITRGDVIEAFARIPQFEREEIESGADVALYYLLQNGVATKNQLLKLVSSKPILDAIRRIYIRVLKRDPERPLDPVAVALWGSTLYRLGLSETVLRSVEDLIRRSPEYENAPERRPSLEETVLCAAA